MKLTLKKKWKWATLDPNGKEPTLWIKKPKLEKNWNGRLGYQNATSEVKEIPSFLVHDLKPGECRRINK